MEFRVRRNEVPPGHEAGAGILADAQSCIHHQKACEPVGIIHRNGKTEKPTPVLADEADIFQVHAFEKRLQ